MFVHMYLELIYNNYQDQAIEFIRIYGPKQEDYYQEDIKKFAGIINKEQMRSSEIVNIFKSVLEHKDENRLISVSHCANLFFFFFQIEFIYHTYVKRHCIYVKASSQRKRS